LSSPFKINPLFLPGLIHGYDDNPVNILGMGAHNMERSPFRCFPINEATRVRLVLGIRLYNLTVLILGTLLTKWNNFISGLGPANRVPVSVSESPSITRADGSQGKIPSGLIPFFRKNT
jgi:hypothetical protein